MATLARSLLNMAPAPARVSVPVLEKGFRPFFLLGGAFAALAVPLWLAALHGAIVPGGAFGAMQWHAHEMIFGFTAAIIAGFLLTAVGNWTSRETAAGRRLFLLCLLWLGGRLAMFFAGSLPVLVTACVDVAFLPALGVACARPLFAAKSRRNYGFLLMLGLLSAMNLVVHAAAWRGRGDLVSLGHRAAVDVIALMIVLVTGRVVPMFTANASGAEWIRRLPALERASLAGMAALVALNLAGSPRISAAASAVVAVLLLARMRFWGSLSALREPLLWSLHAGAAWLPFALLLRAASAIEPSLPATASLHALTAGAIGTTTLAMMARVSLGHTGRMLKAPRAMTFAFAALLLAAGVRVGASFFPPGLYLQALALSALLWSVAFGTFFAAYFRVLTERRVDGR